MLTKLQVLYLLLLLCLLAGCAVKTPLPVAKNNTATPTRPSTSAPTVARTNTPTVTPLPPATSTPTLTATPVPPANPLILQYGWFGGDGGEVTDGYFGRMTPNLALYADGLLVIRQGESYYDEDLTFLETRLSQTEMCDLLAQIEATGYFKEIDPIFTIDRMFGEGQPTLRIQINGPYLKKISSEIERVGDLIPEIGNAYKILKAYRPQGMTPYRPQQLVLWIEPGISPEDGTTSIPWPDNLPPLSNFIPVDRYWNEAGRKLLEGESAIEALALFDNTLSGRFFKHNNQDYYVIARPLLPNEEFSPDRPGLSYSYNEYDFAEPIPCGNEAVLPGEQTICTLQQEFKLANLPLDDLTRLDFVDDDTLALAGWGPRPTPTPGPTPTPQPTTPPVYGDNVTSPRRAYYQAVLNLSDATVEPITPQFEPLNNPCGDSPCALDVLDQSPDGQWQLLHIWANGGGAEGAWLVSAQDARWLGEPFVPFDSFWQWAQDGSLLWYQRVGPGYGLTAENYVVQLASPPLVQAIPVDWDHPLDANGYRPVFSPADKTIYSVRRFETTSGHFEWPDTQQYHFDLTQDLSQPIARETVPHLAQITWNEASQSFWQVFIDDGVTLAEINGNRRLSIPFIFFEGYMESIANGTLELIDIIPQSNITIGPAGRQVALNIRGKRVLLFECGN